MTTTEWWLHCPHCGASQTEFTGTPNPQIILKCQSCERISPFGAWKVGGMIIKPETKPRYDPRFEAEDTTEPMVPLKGQERTTKGG